MEVTAQTGDELYLKAIDAVLLYGAEVSPRGLATRELTNVTLFLSDPTTAVPLNVGRGVNLRIGATEYVHLVGAYSSLEQLNAASNGRFSRFADGGRLRGAYGPRTAGQFHNVVRKLAEDPDSRQACVVIWREGDLAVSSRDTPCTTGFQFRVRNGELDMRTTMRSNDAWLGLPYDIFMFTRLQMSMAWALKLRVGEYSHSVGSFHIYEQDVKKAESLSLHETQVTQPPALETGYTKRARTVESPSLFVDRWEQVQRVARYVGFRHLHDQGSERVRRFGDSYAWYAQHVPELPATMSLCSLGCNYSYLSEDGSRRMCPSCRTTTRDAWKLTQLNKRLSDLGSTESYEDVLKRQGNACATCGRHESDCAKSLHIDHDHATGKFRGLLCQQCNVSLGLVDDNVDVLSRMIRYLNDER